MGGFSNWVTIVGLIAIAALLLLLFCRYLGGWTKTRTWLTSSREEKMVLTRGGMTGHFNPNGYMIPSDSDLNLSGGGSFRRFDKTDTDFALQGPPNSRQAGIPPQPLRPAPNPPAPILSQSSVDSVFAGPNSPIPPPPKIPPPPQASFRPSTFPTLSATNPFLPLLQASTQFFSQTMSSFQPNPVPTAPAPANAFQNSANNAYAASPQPVSSLSSSSTNSTSPRGRISMGELLFSAPPIYPTPDPYPVTSSAEPLSQLPILNRGEPSPASVAPEPEVDLLQHHEVEPTPVSSNPVMTTQSLVESMRAELRLENEKMQDATKSLMEGDEADGPRSTRPTDIRLSTSKEDTKPEPPTTEAEVPAPATNPVLLNPRLGGERKFSAPEIGLERQQVNPPVPVAPSSSYRSRSFSLRQASVDSIGDSSDLGSPDGSPSNLPFLQRAMSCDSVCSDTSVVLGDLDAPHITGHLCVGLEYDSETADLIVNVMEGKELVGLDPDPAAPFDSYVRVYLLPDKTTNMQTRIYRKSLSPVYKEKFMFGLEASELPTRSLVFYLYITNKFSNTLIGEAELKLSELDASTPRITWLPLTDTGQRGGELGEIMFSLSYLPTAERLTVVVVKARNLKFPHQRETGDPFVKVYLLQRGKKISKKKSSTKRAEKNPIFNEAMIFSVPTHALQTIQLRITVSDSSEMEGRAYSIGHVIVGAAASGKPLSHWNQMLSSLRKPIAMWHSLKK